jgi:hypothetical protein
MTTSAKAAPGRLYWTLCVLVLPATNVFLLFARGETVFGAFGSGAVDPSVLRASAILLAAEILGLGRLLAHQGYEGPELGGWMTAGAVATVALTAASAVATFLVVYISAGGAG